MIRRHKPLVRKTPLRRSAKPLKRTRIARVSSKRLKEKAEYAAAAKVYLFDHPLCQITLAEERISEQVALAELKLQLGNFGLVALQQIQRGLLFMHDKRGICIPWATEVHHRNKRRAGRLNDQRFWMAANREMHDRVELRKDWARERGYLLPFEADADGRLPNGQQCLETDELLRIRASGGDAIVKPPFFRYL